MCASEQEGARRPHTLENRGDVLRHGEHESVAVAETPHTQTREPLAVVGGLPQRGFVAAAQLARLTVLPAAIERPLEPALV